MAKKKTKVYVTLSHPAFPETVTVTVPIEAAADWHAQGWLPPQTVAELVGEDGPELVES